MNKKFKKVLFKVLSFLNYCEGFSHLIMACISYWGIVSHGIWDIRLMASPLEATFWGAFSIITGYILGGDHHHHGHLPLPKIDEDEEKIKNKKC